MHFEIILRKSTRHIIETKFGAAEVTDISEFYVILILPTKQVN